MRRNTIPLLEKIINRQNIFNNPVNALSSSEESVKVKHLKHHTFISVCIPFHLVQSDNTEFM